jgi:hypothetical protein
VELLNYLVMVELTECQSHPQSLKPAINPNLCRSEDSITSETFSLNAQVLSHRTPGSLRYCWQRLILIQKSICLCLGAYGGALGLSSGGEFAEQPSQFNGIVSCLENIFKVAALIPAGIVSCLGDFEDFLPMLNNPSLGLDIFQKRTSQRALLELQATTAELKMVYAVATSLLKHWPDNDIVNGITGAGHVQMLAFIKAAELLILSSGALPIHLPRLLVNIRNKLENKSVSPSQGPTSTSTTANPAEKNRTSLSLKLPLYQRDCIHNIFLKLFSCMRSAHFKVSLQSLSLLNNPMILKKYFIDNDDNDHYHPDDNFCRYDKVGDLRIK